jgi:hypothetical protein
LNRVLTRADEGSEQKEHNDQRPPRRI